MGGSAHLAAKGQLGAGESEAIVDVGEDGLGSPCEHLGWGGRARHGSKARGAHGIRDARIACE